MSVEVEYVENEPTPAPVEVVEVVDADVPAVEPAEVVDVEAEPDREEPEKPGKNPEYATPQDTVTALRMIRKLKLIEPDDDAETRMHVKNLVVAWITSKRAGNTDQEWEEWFTTPDEVPEPAAEPEEGSEDPT